MDPEEILRRQEEWDMWAAQVGERQTIAVFGPRPTLPEESFSLGGLFGGVADAAEGFGRGVAQTGTSMVGGIAGIADALVPGEGPGHRIATSMREVTDAIGEDVPDTVAGRTGRAVGRIGSEIATAVVPGMALGKVTKLGKLAPWLGVGADVGVEAAIEAGQRPEDSLAAFFGQDESAQTALGRAAFGATGAGAFGVIAEGLSATKKLSATRRAAREAELDEAAEEAERAISALRADPVLDPDARLRDFGDTESTTLLEGMETGTTSAGSRRLAAQAAEDGLDPLTASPLPNDPARGGFRTGTEIAADITASAQRVARLSDQVANARGANRQRLAAQLLMEQAEQAKKIEDYFPSISGAARELVSHRWRLGSATTATGLYKQIDDIVGTLTPAQRRKVDSFVEFGDAGEIVQIKDMKGLTKFLEMAKEPSTWGEVRFFTDLVKSGMLSALYSPLRAGVGNTASVATQAVGSPFRAGLDKFLSYYASRLSGEAVDRTYTLGSVGTQLRQAKEGAVAGVGQARAIMRHGLVDKNPFGSLATIDAQDLQNMRRTESGFMIGDTDVVGTWKDLWFRLQGAMDTPFRTAVARATIAQEADMIARNFERLDPDKLAGALRRKGVSAEQAAELAQKTFDQRVAALIENPTAEMQFNAMQEALFTAFQKESLLNDIVQKTRHLIHGDNIDEAVIPRRAAAALFDMTVPFSKTPSAIATRVVEAIPVVGGALSIFDLLKMRKLAKEAVGQGTVDLDATVKAINDLQRRIGQRTADNATASLTMLALGVGTGADAFREGWITGGMPKDTQEREAFQRAGKVPYGINLSIFGGEDRWYSLAQLPPVGQMLAVGAAIGQWEADKNAAIERGEAEVPGFADLLGRVGMTAMDAVKEAPFLQGIQRLSRADKDFTGLAASYAASTVPNLLASMARAEDPIRLKRREGFTETVADEVIEKIPWLNQNLPGRADKVLGGTIQRENSNLARALSLIDPFGSSPSREDDIVVRTLANMSEPPSAARQLTGETDREYNARLEVEGKMVHEVLHSVLTGNPDYATLGMIGVGLDDVSMLQRLSQMESSPEVENVKSDIIRNIISRVRSFQTRFRGEDNVGEVRGAEEESPLSTLGVLGASTLPGIGEGMDVYDIGMGIRERDPARAAIGAVGLALPFVPGKGVKAFFDRLRGAVQEAPARMPANQWAQYLTSPKRDVSQNQVEYTGIEGWLREQGDRVLTKEEVDAAIAARSFKLDETVRGEGDPLDVVQRALMDDDVAFDVGGEAGVVTVRRNWGEGGYDVKGRDGMENIPNREEALSRAEDLARMEAIESPTGFKDFTQPGPKENYREVTVEMQRPKGDKTPSFEDDKHFDGENILGHIRMSDRVSDDGKKTLFIEELQSDWLQAQRGRPTVRGKTKRGEAATSVSEADRMPNMAIPEAPYGGSTDEWVGLLVRKTIDEAVAGDYDRIMFASGDQVADLFDVRKRVEAVELTPTGQVNVIAKGGYEQVYDGDESLDALIGKGNAERLRAAPLVDDGFDGVRRLEAADMVDGGDGSREFYNRILPKVVQNEARRAGFSVKRLSAGSLPTDDFSIRAFKNGYEISPAVDGWHVLDDAGEAVGSGRTPEEAIESALEFDPDLSPDDLVIDDAPTNLYLEVTPELMQGVKDRGLRLWEAAPIAGAVGAGVARGQREREEQRQRGVG